MSAARNSFQSRTKGAYANNQHQLKAEIKENPRKTSFYRAIKLCVGVLLILDSDATPFTRNLGCNTVPSFNRLCQRYDLQQGFNKVSNSNFHRFMTVSYITCKFNFDRENPCNCACFSLPDVSTAQHFCHVLLLLFGYFCRWHFFLHFHLRLVRRRKEWRIWCCFEESIAVEERDLVGTSWASNGKWYVFCRFVLGFFAEHRPKMEEICILWFLCPWFVKSATLNYAPICFLPLVNIEERWDILTHEIIFFALLFFFKSSKCRTFFRKQTAESHQVPTKKKHSAWEFFRILKWLEVASLHRRS